MEFLCTDAFTFFHPIPRILESLSHFEGSVHIDREGDESLVMFEEDSIAVLLLEINVTQFTNQTFIAMVEEDIGTVISLRLRNSFSVANSSQFEFSINIPETLPMDAPELTDPVRLSYNIFTTAKLFQNDPDSKFAGNISDGNLTVGDIVISASVPTAGKVDGLVRNNITITFTKPQVSSQVVIENSSTVARQFILKYTFVDGSRRWNKFVPFDVRLLGRQ